MNKIIYPLSSVFLVFYSMSIWANSSALIFHAERDGTGFYIIGTKHDVAFSELSPPVREFLENRIEESETLTVESIAPANNKIEDFFSMLQEVQAFHDIEISHDEIFAELLKRIKMGLASRFNMQGDALNRLSHLKPWALLMIASYISLEARTAISLDTEIATKFVELQIAKGMQDIKYFGLETRKDFVSAFANKTFKNMSAEDLQHQAQFFLTKNQLDEGGEDYSYSDYSRDFYDISKAYDEGEVKQLFKTSTDARNISWMENLQKLIDGGALTNKNLMAVGLSHLLGSESGLLALLMKNGFKVEKYDDAKINIMNQDGRSLATVQEQSALTQRIAEIMSAISKAAAEGKLDEVAKLSVESQKLWSQLKGSCDILKESK